MKDRLRLVRKDMKLTQADMGRELGCSQTAYAKYESGMVVPDKPVRMLFCEKFNVNPVWLETGEGVPYKEGLIPSLVHALQQMPDVLLLLEQKLPYVSDDTLHKMNDALRAFIADMEK